MLEHHSQSPNVSGKKESGEIETTPERLIRPTTEIQQECGTGYRTLAAWGLTMALNCIPTQFAVVEGEERCWKTFPVCDSEALRMQTHSHLFFRHVSSCESLLFLFAAATFVYWNCVFELFKQRRWREEYLPYVTSIAMIVLFPLALIIRDPGTVFLRILPTIIDVCASVCLFLDYFKEKR